MHAEPSMRYPERSEGGIPSEGSADERQYGFASISTDLDG